MVTDISGPGSGPGGRSIMGSARSFGMAAGASHQTSSSRGRSSKPYLDLRDRAGRPDSQDVGMRCPRVGDPSFCEVWDDGLQVFHRDPRLTRGEMSTGRLYGASRIVERRYRALVVVLLVTGLCAGISYSGADPADPIRCRRDPVALRHCIRRRRPLGRCADAGLDCRERGRPGTGRQVGVAADLDRPARAPHLREGRGQQHPAHRGSRAERRTRRAAGGGRHEPVPGLCQGPRGGGEWAYDRAPVPGRSCPRLRGLASSCKYGLLGLVAGLFVGMLVVWKKRRDWRERTVNPIGRSRFSSPTAGPSLSHPFDRAPARQTGLRVHASRAPWPGLGGPYRDVPEISATAAEL